MLVVPEVIQQSVQKVFQDNCGVVQVGKSDPLMWKNYVRSSSQALAHRWLRQLVEAKKMEVNVDKCNANDEMKVVLLQRC